MPRALTPLQEPEQSYRLYPSLKVQGHSEPSLYLNKRILFTEHTWLQDHNAAAAGATRCSNPQNFFQKEQSSTRIHAAIRDTSRHFDTLRPHRQDIDRIQSRAGHHMNSCSALPRSAPVRRPPRRRRRPSPSLPSPVIHREFSCPISPNLSYARPCLNTHPTAQTSF